ncbi:DNA-binding protein [Gracilibacillus kekensis]|uniref:Helix-turn-helix domain-containing protein n=1 Tax=Gracilibacillus kekensis TaxID=1027249 RepID=A0A1M7QI17_9BACI|nr:DNA-binding protein [Gracilibacillus kekensis]SHN30553.1 hypothetical protein SAMN05216179_3187 [Gracilibacillus kekensis]
MNVIILALGIATAGYFIGRGLENFQNPDSSNSLTHVFDEEDELLIKEKEVHHYIGISKEDAQTLLSEYSNVPHIRLNGNIYFNKSQLKEWLSVQTKQTP